MTDEAKNIYFAGVFDVRGAIRPGLHHRHNWTPTISLLVRDEGVAREALEYFGVGKISTVTAPNPPHTQNYLWKCGGYFGPDAVAAVVEAVHPYLRTAGMLEAAEAVLERQAAELAGVC